MNKDDILLEDQTNSNNKNGETGDTDGTGKTGDTNNTTSKTDTSILNAVKGSGYSNYKPNSTGETNTGTGATSALGTDYSWNQQGTQAATKQYEQDLLTQDQNYLQNRSTIENNAVNYQAQSDMMKYQNNQTAEKVGWTGGYVLDQNRQSEYLKQSIQAQMYGAMELQKYGYDSALSAARLSYDLNQQEFAHKYYQEAQAAALSEAQLTGVYFSAEVKDMMAQLGVAKQKKNDQSLSQEERDKATKLEQQIEDWFKENKISKEGVKTLEAWQAEQATELQWSNELWERYNATMKTLESDFATNPSKFIWLDENGDETFDGLNIKTGNWDAMSGADILNYITTKDKQGNTVLNGYASNQFYSYLDSSIVGQAESGFAKWCESQGYIKVDKDGNRTSNPPPNGFANALLQYIMESDVVDKFVTMFEGEDTDTVEKLLGNWDFTIQLPDGQMFTTKYKDLVLASEQQDGQQPGDKTTITYTSDDGKEYKWENEIYQSSYPGPYGNKYYKTTLSNGMSICITTARVGKNGDSISLKEDNSLTDYTCRKRTFNLDAREQESKDLMKEIELYYKAMTNETLEPNRLFILSSTNTDGTRSSIPYTYNIEAGTYAYYNNDCGSSSFETLLKKDNQWVY